jgi:type I restriction enzyme, S subunit
MELKAGYKQTEVGVIPEDWDVRTFGEIFSYLSTATNSRSDLTEGAGVFYIHYGDIHTKFHNHLNFVMNKPPKIDRSKCRNAALIRNGDWVMADASEDYDGVGKTIEVTGLEEGQKAIAGLHTFLLREKSSTFVPGFKGHLGGLKSLHEEYLRVATGMKVFGVSKTALVDLHLPVPNKAEQEAIAKALSDADALIESLEHLIAKKRQIKQGAMQELLTGKKRLTGFSGEWEVKRIGEFTDCTAGGTPSTAIPTYWGGEIRWMSSGELNLRTVSEVEGRITEEGLRNSSTKMIPENCILIGLAGQGKTRGTVAINTVPLCTNQSIAAIFPNAMFAPRFLYYNLDSRYDELRELSAGDGGRGGLNLTLIRSIAVPFPCIAEQTAIAEILSDMDAELAALDTKLSKARQMKQGMMQELLTGKIRLI